MGWLEVWRFEVKWGAFEVRRKLVPRPPSDLMRERATRSVADNDVLLHAS